MGFPIRKSAGQRLLTPHRSLSQRATSFIACVCQGIHQLPLPHASESTPPTTDLELGVVGVPGAFTRSCWPRTLPVAALQKESHSQLDNLVVYSMPLLLGRRTARSRETMPPRHRFLEPIHNVKEGPEPPIRGRGREIRVFMHGKWWSLSGS